MYQRDHDRSSAPGQSIPLIALLIVVLIAMVGLSVDVGNTYAQQRNTVRATNAAALAGMTELIRSNSDQKAGQIIQDLCRGLGARHNLARLIQEIPAGLGQHDTAADAVKQLDPVTRLQRGDRGAGC